MNKNSKNQNELEKTINYLKGSMYGADLSDNDLFNENALSNYLLFNESRIDGAMNKLYKHDPIFSIKEMPPKLKSINYYISEKKHIPENVLRSFKGVVSKMLENDFVSDYKNKLENQKKPPTPSPYSSASKKSFDKKEENEYFSGSKNSNANLLHMINAKSLIMHSKGNFVANILALAYNSTAKKEMSSLRNTGSLVSHPEYNLSGGKEADHFAPVDSLLALSKKTTKDWTNIQEHSDVLLSSNDKSLNILGQQLKNFIQRIKSNPDLMETLSYASKKVDFEKGYTNSLKKTTNN